MAKIKKRTEYEAKTKTNLIIDHISYIPKAQTRVFESIDLAFRNQVDTLSTQTQKRRVAIHSFHNMDENDGPEWCGAVRYDDDNNDEDDDDAFGLDWV